jgi:uncharacterized repeat protein (TIGR02543 family)
MGYAAFYKATALNEVNFDGNAPTVSRAAFGSIGNDPVANVSPAATGFGNIGDKWNGLTLVFPPSDVTFDSQGGTLVDPQNTASVTSAPDTTRDGYSFMGWFVSQTGGVAIEFPYLVSSAITLYAQWEFAWPNVGCSESGSFLVTDNVVTGNTNCAGEAVIPDGVTSIGKYAFSRTSLTSVTFPDSLESIGYAAFARTSLTSVTFPDSLTTIGDSAFYLATSLTSVTFDGNAPTTGGTDVFLDIGENPVANVKSTATGFGVNGADWNGLTVTFPSDVTFDSQG